MNKSKNTYNMIDEDILKSIVFFSIPLLGTSIIQQLYNTTDFIFIGNFIGKKAAAAVGASSLLFTCLIGLFTGISIGVSIITSQTIGENKKEKLQSIICTAFIFSILLGIFTTIFGLIFSNIFLKSIKIPLEIKNDAEIYLNVYLLSMLPMILYNIFSGIIRASGNSKITLYILAIGGFFNIIGNYFFIVFLELGVAGASISTLISQIITASLSIFYVIKSGLFSINNLKFSKFNSNILKTILYNGLPSGIQASIMTFSNIILQYFINTYGEDIIAAYITYFKVENFLWLPIVAIGQAVTTFVGQNYGAKNYKRIKKGVVVATILSITIVLILIVIISSFPNMFFKIFIKDITVIRLGIDLLYFIFPFYWLYSILENFGAALRGIGHSLLSMTVGIITLSLTRILILIYLSKLNVGYKELAIIYPVTWSLTAISYSVLFFIYLKIKISEDFFLKEKIRIFTICSQILK